MSYTDNLPETKYADLVDRKAKGLFRKPENRRLLVDDIKGCEAVLVKVYTNDFGNYFLIPKDTVLAKSITTKITNWYFQKNDLSESLEKPDSLEKYNIIIGDVFSIHV